MKTINMAKNDPRNIETSRTKALKWWNKLKLLEKSNFTGMYFTGRRQSTLTDKEIESIYNSIINKPFCNLKGKGSCSYELKNGECKLKFGKCKNHKLLTNENY